MEAHATQAPEAGAALQRLIDNIESVIFGKREVVELAVIALLARGHLLLEDLPGTGKTMLARALSKSLDLDFKRVQFTPDLMPSDVVGTQIFEPATGQFRLRRGPVFTQLLLGDEINRAPAKTQSALLEVMQETQVTLEGQTLPLPRPFMVLATQNPIDTEGTYPLPEAQRDRFLLKVDIGYPDAEDEVDVVLRATSHQAGDALPLADVQPVLGRDALIALQALVVSVKVDRTVADYAVRIARATRDAAGLSQGAGSRGAIALIRVARAAALLDGRDYAIPDDVKRFALPALRHRVMLSPDAQLDGRLIDEILLDLVERTDAPRA